MVNTLFSNMVEQEGKKEDFAKQFMTEEGLKGKAKRIKIMSIIDKVGYDKRKIRVAFLRSTITERVQHEWDLWLFLQISIIFIN